MSMVQTYQPPLMDVNGDTIPELQPVFTLLNSHSNKLYQEGYFLKLDDQNTHGKANPDRTWTECFAQLVGTVLSLWDAAELDAAGEEGEVLPKFINLTDASIKMIETLPTQSNDEQPLQNILSISTAGRNRYLLHFNSHHSLVQWTAGIRLAMYEHSALQEAYTGALIAGKGKLLNNINVIMERARFETGDWVRVRFGAGVPWRRCWCVITPPDEKEYAKLQKELKKRSPYDRSQVPALKGDIKFYDQKQEPKKRKKVQPIATITDAYSAYAIYPQAKSLVDASTLLKIEGQITIHTDPPSASEGFVFIMPETRPAVSGFEMLLRFLFPTWDTFGMYGRPGRLIASVLDSRALMFAMPKHRRYGYLELLDVTGLIVDNGSSTWNEREWRRRLKEATGTRMNAIDDGTLSGSNGSARSSYGGGNSNQSLARPKVGFADGEQVPNRTSRSFSLGAGPQRTDSAPADARRDNFKPAMSGLSHSRNSSDPSVGVGAPAPPPQQSFMQRQQQQMSPQRPVRPVDADSLAPPSASDLAARNLNTPEPVSRPPAFNHSPEARPTSKVYHSPELRRANSRLSVGTLAQLAGAGGLAVSNNIASGDANNRSAQEDGHGPNVDQRPMDMPPPLSINRDRAQAPFGSPHGPPGPYNQMPGSPARPQTSDGRRPSQSQAGGPPNQNRPPMPPPQGSNWSNRSKTPPAGGFGRGRPPNPNSPGPHPPRQDSFKNTGPSPFSSGPAQGFRDADYQKPIGFEEMSVPSKHSSAATSRGSITTNEIIEQYATNHGLSGPTTSAPRELPYRGPGPDSGPPSRAGVLRTVGGGNEPGPRPDFEVPNFGPTYNYAQGPPSPSRGRGQPPPQQRPYSPAGPRPGFVPQAGPNEPPKRTMAWQPGGAAAGSGRGVTPEQFVQQRAAVGQPQFSHARSPSGNPLPEASSAMPTHVRRSSSFEMLQQRRSRSGSVDMLQRPPSRGGNGAFDPISSGETSSYLNARDQEHMARVTGGPLMGMAGGPQRVNSPGPGLVGAIDARERERQQIRQGVNDQAAYGMSQRPMQQGPYGAPQSPMGARFPPQGMNDGGRPPQPMYHQPMGRAGDFGPEGGPVPPGAPYGQQFGRSSPGPQGGPYGPQAGRASPASFSRPLREGTRSPFDPRQRPPPGHAGPGQYAPSPHPGAGAGPGPGGNGQQRNVYPQYQGQAF